MAYSLTSAANPKALLAAIITFATSQGWTIEYNKADGTGTGVGGQIALSSDGCHVAIGEASTSENPVAVTGALGAANDGRLYMALADSISNSSFHFWGHPGSPVVSVGTATRIMINDVWGAMSEVHFFGDANFILVAVKCAAQRWTSFGFGNLDKKGMTIGSCGFAYSNWHQWWNTSSAGVFINAALSSGNGYIGNTSTDGNGGIWMLRIPSGVLDTSLGFLSGSLFPTMQGNVRHTVKELYAGMNYPEQTISSNAFGTCILDHVLILRNQLTTGGVPLSVCPAIYQDLTINLQTFLGEIPGMRICRMSNLTEGQQITYGSDDYLVFPFKQKGNVADGGYNGGTYNNQPNSFDMGYAFRKD